MTKFFSGKMMNKVILVEMHGSNWTQIQVEREKVNVWLEDNVVIDKANPDC